MEEFAQGVVYGSVAAGGLVALIGVLRGDGAEMLQGVSVALGIPAGAIADANGSRIKGAVTAALRGAGRRLGQ